MPVAQTSVSSANKSRLGEMLGEVGVDKRTDGIPVRLGLLEERLGELIWSTLGIYLDESAVSRILLFVEGGVFGGGGGLLLIDDLLACEGLCQYSTGYLHIAPMRTRGKKNRGNAGLSVPLRTELLSRLRCDHEEVG